MSFCLGNSGMGFTIYQEIVILDDTSIFPETRLLHLRKSDNASE